MKPFHQQWAEITKIAKERIEKAIIEASGQVYSEVVDKTPVRSGDLRKSWEIDYGQGYLALAGSYGDKAQAINLGVSYELGDDIWIRSQKPYAERIEYGYSRQAPTGMVRISIKKYKQFLDRAVRKYKF